MRDPEMFKYDVRVRERMIKAGRLVPEELNKHLSALEDLEANTASVDLEQPALGRQDSSVATRPSVPPPVLSTADRDVDGSQGTAP